MCEYLAICDSTFAAVTSSCSWHIALGVGTLFFGPIIVIILAMLRLTFYIRKHEDECYEKRPKPPSLVAVFRWSPRTRKARARAFSPCQASRAAWHHPTLSSYQAARWRAVHALCVSFSEASRSP